MSPDVWKKLTSDPLFILGAALFAIMAFLLVGGSWLGVHDPHDMSFAPLSSPSLQHWLGVNDGGMDIFAELLAGIKNTLVFSLLAGLTSLLLGVVIGMLCAWVGGLTDQLLMRFSDILLAIPSIMLLILVAAFFRVSAPVLELILAAMTWPTTAKIVRAQALVIRKSLHIQAARHMGASGFYIIRRHMLPELFPVYLVGFASKLRMAISMETTLSFLGLFDPARKSLGMMINYALKYYYLDIWWNWFLPPVLCLTMLIMATTLISLSMERVFDPRLGGFVEAGSR